ncbi:hypothetical protein SLITO_v1c04510 [Spiroplasma litorale]|uniref:Uncharacterized protein n=1 Tax=Spiroplasma litorale TaxID=216942 RepID=A0A0K1W1A2_9MOLU|nr:hypothetical protein [Spiroplasma litorale]AKX34104.1 hypothetical protein SLITO_v1c04510 [Spiroplasma litorale]
MIDSGDEEIKNQGEQTKVFAEVFLTFDKITQRQAEYYLRLYSYNVKVNYESDEKFIESIMDINNITVVDFIANYTSMLSRDFSYTSPISRFWFDWVIKGKVKITEKTKNQIDYLWTKLFLHKEQKFAKLTEILKKKVEENKI